MGNFQDRADHRRSLSSSGVLILAHNVYSQIHPLALRIYVTAIAILSLISSMGAIDELACRIYCAALSQSNVRTDVPRAFSLGSVHVSTNS